MSEPSTWSPAPPADAHDPTFVGEKNTRVRGTPRRARLTAADLRGVWVPLITPLSEDGAVDEAALLALADDLLDAGVSGLVLAGTTGESPTLRFSEIERMLPALLDRVDGRVPILVGTGTNDTAASVEHTARARALGADGAFAVCPYYSRPAPAGVIAHYRAIAAVGLPTVAYHIPYRTGLVLDRPTLQAILAIPGVIGLKESSGGIDQVAALARPDGPAILCGEDALFLRALEVGGHGGIVAAANLVPAAYVDAHRAFAAGQPGRAEAAFAGVLPLVELLFAEPNPAPLKWALHRQGRIPSAAMRLPMTPISEALAARLAAALPPTAAEVQRLVGGFEAATVPAGAWTHRSHLVVGTWYVHQQGPGPALTRMRTGILRLNHSHGTPETASRGYHETITRAYLALIAGLLESLPQGASIETGVTAVLASPIASRDVLFRHYSRERLLSPGARREFCPPDLQPLETR